MKRKKIVIGFVILLVLILMSGFAILSFFILSVSQTPEEYIEARQQEEIREEHPNCTPNDKGEWCCYEIILKNNLIEQGCRQVD